MIELVANPPPVPWKSPILTQIDHMSNPRNILQYYIQKTKQHAKENNINDNGTSFWVYKLKEEMGFA